MKRVFAEIEAFKTDGPTEKQVADAKEGFIRDYETNIKSNGYLLSQHIGEVPVRRGGRDRLSLDLPALYNRLTAAAIQDAARQYLNTQRYVKVMLIPEKK